MEEMTLIVIFDIPNTKLRNRINEKCKDYGLTHFQLSGYKGTLPADMRTKFIEEIKNMIGTKEAKVYIQPICAGCLKASVQIINLPKKEEPSQPQYYFGMPLNRAYMAYEDDPE